MKRLFIGVPVESEKVVQTTATWRKNELLNGNVLKWVKPENWHITLIFLGNTPESSIPELQQFIKESFRNIQTFNTELRGVGVFPNTHNPKVLWIGLQTIESLIAARNQLDKLLKTTGYVFDSKPLKPHLTLARIKNINHRTTFNSLLDHYCQSDFGSVAIGSVILYESVSTSEGPVYKPLFVNDLDA